MGKSTIEWTEETWNPVRGCRRVSPGCQNCYAERIATRFSGPGQCYEGLVTLTGKATRHSQTGAATTGVRGRWNGKVKFVEDTLLAPLHWHRPRRVFVNSMSDLFYEGFTDEEIEQVFAIMALCPHHTFQVLTKRGGRMQKWFQGPRAMNVHGRAYQVWASNKRLQRNAYVAARWPLPNVVLGVSAENQPCADERLAQLRATPAATRMVSYEPALERVNFHLLGTVKIDWLIAGAESGPGARPMDEDWVRSARDQCTVAGVAFFYKQNAVRGRKLPLPMLDGRQWMQYPEVRA